MITMLIMTSLMVVTMGISSVLLAGIKMGGAQVRSTKAFFAAEAGAERTLWEIRKNGFDPNDIGDPCVRGEYINLDTDPASCDAGVHEYELPNFAKYYIIFESGAPNTIIKNYGEYLGTKRTIEIMY